MSEIIIFVYRRMSGFSANMHVLVIFYFANICGFLLLAINGKMGKINKQAIKKTFKIILGFCKKNGEV